MIISELRREYINRLSEKYTTSESGVIFSIFVEKELGYNKIQQKVFENELIDNEKECLLKNYLGELEKGKPYQQILGEVDFFGLPFMIDDNVLIPRPETEELLEIAIEGINKKYNNNIINILEVGAGSGVISIILKKNFPNANITSFDISEKAIYVACENAKKHSVEINFVQKDYLNYQFVDEKYDVIISNPPYIGMDERGEISDSVKKFEPNVALFSPIEDTLIFYRKISQDARQILNKNGLIFLEINQKLGQETLSLYGGFQAKLMQDLSGNDRFVCIGD